MSKCLKIPETKPQHVSMYSPVTLKPCTSTKGRLADLDFQAYKILVPELLKPRHISTHDSYTFHESQVCQEGNLSHISMSPCGILLTHDFGLFCWQEHSKFWVRALNVRANKY